MQSQVTPPPPPPALPACQPHPCPLPGLRITGEVSMVISSFNDASESDQLSVKLYGFPISKNNDLDSIKPEILQHMVREVSQAAAAARLYAGVVVLMNHHSQ